MENIEKIRHSLAHLLGASILELYPGSQITLGPAIEHGFYYDVDVKGKITDADLEKIEKKMREILKTWTNFEKKVLTKDEALEFFKGNVYKEELINEIAKKAKVKKLFLTHISSRYDKNPKLLVDESRKVFKNSELAKDLESFEI